MEYLKSLYFVSYNKFNYHFSRKNSKTSPVRIFEEDGIIKKINSFLFSEPSHIIDNIYLGNGNNAANINTLTKYKIDIIINVTSELDNYFENDNTNNFEYYKFELLDEKNNDISIYFKRFITIINENKKKNIFIHCFMGSSRSAIMVLLYMIKVKKLSYEDSLKLLKEKRDIVNINVEFINQLKKFL